jgi:predicted homoserine dehydrogenase-like protein
MGLAAGCRVLHRIPRDSVLTYRDVTLPTDREVDRLWREQVECFSAAAVA